MTDDKYIAPPWIKYPTAPEKSDFWRNGSGAEYLIKFNKNITDKDKYYKIFPKAPTFTQELEPSTSLSEDAQELGLKIVSHMRKRIDEATEKYKLNFSLIATPAEGLSGRFTEIDKKIYGEITGITDKEYYTNSFHVPVYYNISAFNKIKIEAPYHELTNGGHITYVELDGDTSNNLQAFETIIRSMKEMGIGYGSVNHPVDRDPVCGFSGVIPGTVCPVCGRNEEESDIKFERIRRITGYLVGTVDRFNDAKKAEVRDRVKHTRI